MEGKKYYIDARKLLKLLWSDRKRLAIYLVVSASIGLTIAFTTPKQYKCTVMLAPEESSAGFSGSISSLVSMLGMNMKLGQTGDALYPEIYPELVGSTDFTLGLFPVMVTSKSGDLTCDYYTYLLNHQKLSLLDIPFWCLGKLVAFVTPKDSPKVMDEDYNGPIWLSKNQEKIAKVVNEHVKCSVDKKTNVISLTVEDQDPFIAATMADTIKSHLQRAITDYRTKKARVDVEYMQKLFVEARQQYDDARHTFAQYADANQKMNLQAYKINLDDLDKDVQLKFSIYQQVVAQLQVARAKVQERTPAFAVMQEAAVPFKHTNMPKVVVLVIWLFLGLACRCCVLFVKNGDNLIN